MFCGLLTLSAAGNAAENVLEKADNAENGTPSGGSNEGTSKTVFPEDTRTFNPDGLVRKEYNNGKIIKWHDPETGKAVYEWNADPKYVNHYHVTPDGKNRMPHLDIGDTQ